MPAELVVLRSAGMFWSSVTDHVFLVHVSPMEILVVETPNSCENNCNVDKRICQRNSNYHVKALSAGSPHRPRDWGLSQDTSPHWGKRGGRQVGAKPLRVWETWISEASWTRCCSSWVILVGERCPSCFSCHIESLACFQLIIFWISSRLVLTICWE